MPTTKNGIEYSISSRGPATNPTERSETWAPGGQQFYEVARLTWGNWRQFVIDMVGQAFWIGTSLNRSLPETHPAYPWAICTDVKFIGAEESPAPVDDFAGFLDGTGVVAGLTYSSVLFQIVDDAAAHNAAAGGELQRYVERPFEFQVENLTLEGQILEFLDTFAAVGAKPAIIFPSTERLYVWKRVPSIQPGGTFPPQLYANILGTMGRVNNDTFDGIGSGLLLCGAPKIKQEVGPTGFIEFEISYPLAQRPAMPPLNLGTWNSKYRLTNTLGATAPGFYPVQIRGSGGNQPYLSAPFAKLFTNAP